MTLQNAIVQPNTGLIQPKDTVEVKILFNLSKEKSPSPPLKDKFQVQYIYLRPGQTKQDPRERTSLIQERMFWKKNPSLKPKEKKVNHLSELTMVELSLEGKKVEALLDTGSMTSLPNRMTWKSRNARLN